MIIVKLYGGIGNQMFQYAFARHLTIKHKTTLKFDISLLNNNTLLENQTPRNVELNNFNIDVQIATVTDITKYKLTKATKIWHLIKLCFYNNAKNLYVKEPHFHFYSKALKCSKNSYLDGYWQSEKYFSDSRAQLLTDFTTQNPLSQKSIELLKQINNSNSISIHVRRGDYISIQSNQNYYHTCTADYYQNAINLVCEKLENPTLFIFSNNEEIWFKQNVVTKYNCVFVSHNLKNDSFQDLILMSKCKHNIIANSSFSWWGAWLNTNSNKIVVAPKKWFKVKNKQTKDLICDKWIVI